MWQDWVNLFLGIFLIISSYQTSIINSSGKNIVSLIIGIAVLILGGMISDKRWPEIVNVVVAAYLIVINFFNVSNSFFQYSLFFGGIVISVFALGAALMDPFPEHGHGSEGHATEH